MKFLKFCIAIPLCVSCTCQESFFESNGPSIKLVTLTNQIYRIIDTDEELFDLASSLFHNGYSSSIDQELFMNTTHWRTTEHQIKTVITKYNNSKHNVVYLSGFLASVFHKIVKLSSISHNQLKLASAYTLNENYASEDNISRDPARNVFIIVNFRKLFSEVYYCIFFNHVRA